MVEKSPLAVTATKQTSLPRKQKKPGTKRKIRRARSQRARKRLPKMRKRAKKKRPRKRNSTSERGVSRRVREFSSNCETRRRLQDSAKRCQRLLLDNRACRPCPW